MKLPAGFGELDFGDWLLGLWSSFVSGGAGAVSAGFSVILTDPEHFNLETGKFYRVVATAFMTAGVIGGMNFLRTKPAPDKRIVETTVKTTDVEDKPTVTTTTIKETREEPINPKP